MIADDGNVDEQLSVKKMEEEKEKLNKVESLRGRLIAERAASKLAFLEADRMECKVKELEAQLKAEIKSRNKADKKLEFLIKKLDSLNIPYFPKDLKKSNLSSVSCPPPSPTQVEEKDTNSPIKTHRNCENIMGKCQTRYKDFQDNVSQITTSKQSSIEDSVLEPCQSCSYANADDDQSSIYTVEDKKDAEENINEARDDCYVEESMALVLFDLPKEQPKVVCNDPQILDANVKQVLGALSHAKEKLLLCRERRHFISVGSKPNN